MAEAKRMVAGFNHNVKHRGKAYHVQTEDSGLDNPRIITLLFDGGNIIASKRTSYSDIVGAENLEPVVRALMEEQHKEMLRNLISGVYDDRHEELTNQARSYQPGEIDVGEEDEVIEVTGGSIVDLRAAGSAPPPIPAAAKQVPTTPAPAVAPPQPPAPVQVAAPPPAVPVAAPPVLPLVRPTAPSTVPPVPLEPPVASPLAATSKAVPPRLATVPPPPSPPASRPTSAPVPQAPPVLMTVTERPQIHSVSGVPSATRPAPVMPLRTKTVPPVAAAPEAGRSEPGATRPPAGRSVSREILFGDELISDKSLDEVILSYLAEDIGQRKG